MEWHDIATAPRDGTPILIKYEMRSNDMDGYVPFDRIGAVIAWWKGWETFIPETRTFEDRGGGGWEICFMEEGCADSYGQTSSYYMPVPENKVKLWMPLPY